MYLFINCIKSMHPSNITQDSPSFTLAQELDHIRSPKGPGLVWQFVGLS